MSRKYIHSRDDGGFPVLLAVDTEDPPEVEERTTEEGVKITAGGSTYDRLSEPARTLLRRTINSNEVDEIIVTPDGNEASIVALKGGEPLAKLASLPTTDSDPVRVNELAYALRPPRSGKPEGVDDREWERRVDAVRDAAREMDFMSEADAREYLQGRASSPELVDLGAFLRDVEEQRIDDLVDILDYSLREKVDGMRRSRRWVRLVGPKGWTQRVFSKLTDEDILTVASRLERRGWKPDDLVDYVIGRVKNEERRDKIVSRYQEGAA